jgi:MFS transporter, PAT family, beta-lactamase induction signal transducer AmpG
LGIDILSLSSQALHPCRSKDLSLFWKIGIFGFSSGLPYCLLSSTLQFWLQESHCSIQIAGLFGALLWPYSLKTLISPWVDGIKIPYLHKIFGQRRSWCILTQFCVGISLLMFAHTDLTHSIYSGALWVFIAALAAATQDLVLETYRIEMTQEKNQGSMILWSNMGFRLGLFFGSYGALHLSSYWSWPQLFAFFGCFSWIGLGVMTLAPNPPETSTKNHCPKDSTLSWAFFKTFYGKIIQEFCHHYSWILVVSFIVLHKFSDMMMRSISNIFFLDIGLSPMQIANYDKGLGLWSMIVGGILGAKGLGRYGLQKTFFFWAILQVMVCIGFSIMYWQSLESFYPWYVVCLSISLFNMASGFGGTAYIGYISGLCFPPHTTGQYALLISFGSLCSSLARAFSGLLKGLEGMSWDIFFGLLILFNLVLMGILSYNKKHFQHFVRFLS